MSFRTSLINAPEDTRYWVPVFYYRDPETGFYIPYSPEEHLNVGESWLCPLSTGAGIIVNYRCRVFDDVYNIIGTRDIKNIVVADGEEFIYNWKVKKEVSPWVILAPVGILTALGVIVAATRKRR